MDSKVLSGSNTLGGWKLSHDSLTGGRQLPPPTFRSANAAANRNLDHENGPSPSEGPFVALECVLIPVALAIWWFWFRGSGRKGPGTATISGLLTNDADVLDNTSTVSSSNDSRTNARRSASDDTEEVASGYEILKCRTAGAAPQETASSAAVVRDQASRARMRSWLPAVRRSNMMERIMAPAFVQRKETNKLHSPTRSIPVDGSSIVSEFRRLSDPPSSPAESSTSTLAATKVVSLQPCETV
jgi:hypothetical protein